MEILSDRACGLDVHKKNVVATIMGSDLAKETRTFSSFTRDLEALKEWLESMKIESVAMESTGVYWKPVYQILESGNFELLLVNARHMKNVPGKKTVVKDSEWICSLLRAGLLRGSFVPVKETRYLRELVRYRKKQVQAIASEKQRMQKILEDANIKLSSVVSDISGVTATEMIDELIKGKKTAKEISELGKGKLKAKLEDLEKSLEGHFTNHHKFMMKTIIKKINATAEIIEELDEEIKSRNEVQEEKEDIELLKTIPGVGQRTAEILVAELGTDMDQFPNEDHLSSWAGLSPGNNESGGKKKSCRTTQGNQSLKTALVEAAWAAIRTKNTYLRSKYERIVPRRGAKRAQIAVAHKILIAAYHILKNKEPYRELGAEFLAQRTKVSQKKLLRYKTELEKYGYKVETA